MRILIAISLGLVGGFLAYSIIDRGKIPEAVKPDMRLLDWKQDYYNSDFGFSDIDEHFI